MLIAVEILTKSRTVVQIGLEERVFAFCISEAALNENWLDEYCLAIFTTANKRSTNEVLITGEQISAELRLTSYVVAGALWVEARNYTAISAGTRHKVEWISLFIIPKNVLPVRDAFLPLRTGGKQVLFTTLKGFKLGNPHKSTNTILEEQHNSVLRSLSLW